MKILTKPVPTCPSCGAQMTLRRPKPDIGGHVPTWSPFWSCSTFPNCRSTRKIRADGKPDMGDWEEPWFYNEDEVEK